MRILITGAAGMLGLDVQRAAADAGVETVALGRDQLDVTDRPAVWDVVSAAGADAVINCAAWTDVDGAESQPQDAFAANATGAGHVAAAAAAAGAWTVHVSSDYVFNGEKPAPYVESDEPDPVSAYGRSKEAGELAVAAAAGAEGGYTIVRSSWLFGAGGRCFPTTILRLASQRRELTVVCDQTGCPTFTADLAPALVALAARRTPGVLHVAGGGQCSWYEFAAAIVAAAGVDCEVRPISTDEYPVSARRPANSVLASERGAPILPHWRGALARFMSERTEVRA